MAAERLPQENHTAEIYYVVIPPMPVRAPSLIDRLFYQIWLVRDSDAYQKVAVVTQSLIGAVGFTVLCCIAMYGLYYLKSILGIDLFGDKHLEDFVPIPGYHRW